MSISYASAPAAAPHVAGHAAAGAQPWPVLAGPDRITYAVEGGLNLSYAHAPERRLPTDVVAEAALVGSLTREGMHAPALDVDVPATVTLDEQGRFTLWLHGTGRVRWRRAATALHAAGLGPKPGRAASRRDRVCAYASTRGRCIDEGDRSAMLRGIGPTLPDSFAHAVTLATTLAWNDPEGNHPTVPLTVGPHLTDPWPLRLHVPAMLLPSTHNWHLYLETTLPWPTYRDLLVGLGRARILEAGYVGASLERGQTQLRLPWVSKDDLP